MSSLRNVLMSTRFDSLGARDRVCTARRAARQSSELGTESDLPRRHGGTEAEMLHHAPSSLPSPPTECCADFPQGAANASWTKPRYLSRALCKIRATIGRKRTRDAARRPLRVFVPQAQRVVNPCRTRPTDCAEEPFFRNMVKEWLV